MDWPKSSGLCSKALTWSRLAYARHRFEGLLNSSIVSPLTRSLYGKRLQNPMGPDLGISRRLYQGVLSADHDATTAPETECNCWRGLLP